MIDSLIIALQDFGPALVREDGSIMQILGASGSRGNYVWGCRGRKRDKERRERQSLGERARKRESECVARACVREGESERGRKREEWKATPRHKVQA